MAFEDALGWGVPDQVWTYGPYGIPILSPNEMALARLIFDGARQIPFVAYPALLGALWFAAVYGIKSKKGSNSSERSEPEI